MVTDEQTELLQLAALAGVTAGSGRAAGPSPSMIGVPFAASGNVRFGVIGAGGRGTSMMREMLALENAEIRAHLRCE